MKKVMKYLTIAAGLLLFAASGLVGYLVSDRNLVVRTYEKLERTRLARNAIKSGQISISPRYVDTSLNRIAVFEIPIDFDERNFFRAGALEQLENFIIITDRQGNISSYDLETNRLDYMRGTVPMQWGVGKASVFADATNFSTDRLRVTDLLLLDEDPTQNRTSMLVAHHRFRLDCIEFIVSEVEIGIENGNLQIYDDTWKTIFNPDICLPPQKGNQAFEGHQSGGRMARYGDREILITTGDYEFDGVSEYREQTVSLDPRSNLGKILRVNLSDGSFEIVADGLRNPQGLVVAEDGRIFETEHGPQGGDEVNLIDFGASYGWPEVTLGTAYGRFEAWPSNPKQGRHEEYRMPIYSFVPSIGISNLVLLDGTGFPQWEGDLLVSSLNGEMIYRLRVEVDEVIYQEAVLNTGMRIRDLIKLRDGSLVALGDGGILFLIKEVLNVETVDRNFEPFDRIAVSGYDRIPDMEAIVHKQTEFNADDNLGRATFNAQCSTCHKLDNGIGIGPALNGVLGREIASNESFGYSESLASVEGVWTERLVINYVLDPSSIAPNGAMGAIGVSREEAAAVASYLRTIPEEGL